MATESRGADASLREVLFSEPYRFSFFQAVRLLTRLDPGRTPVGGGASPSDEVVRFRSHVTLAFPPSEIYDLTESGSGRRARTMTVAFMGLTGTSGVLPRHYTEHLLERMKAKDFVLRDFLDLFNHRLLSLFYRVWEKHRVPIQFERSAYVQRSEDRFGRYVFSLMGLGTPGLRGRLTADDQFLLAYGGLLAQRPRSACALKQWLSHYFDVPVSILQLIGEWLELGQEDWTRLGVPGVNNRLGISATAGTRVWDQQAGIEIRVGPMAYQQYERLLPSGKAFGLFVAMTRFFVGRELSFNVRPLLTASEVPECRVSETESYAPRLGWTTWLKTKPFTQDAEQVVFSGHVRTTSAVSA